MDEKKKEPRSHKKDVKKEKRKPGRPKKLSKKELAFKGIIPQPNIIGNMVEFVYGDPMVMKRMWHFFKLLSAEKIQFSFSPRNIHIWGIDHHRKSRILVSLDASKMNEYYCSSNVQVCLTDKNFDAVMNRIDKSHESIQICIPKTDLAVRNVSFTITNNICDEKHMIDVNSEMIDMFEQHEFYDEAYKLSFTFPGKYFKKMITDVKTLSNKLLIKQDSDSSPLVFGHMGRDNSVTTEIKFNDPKVINFVSHLERDKTFCVGLVVDFIKPIGSALANNSIVMFADEDKPFMSLIKLNETFEVRILTEIIDSRAT